MTTAIVLIPTDYANSRAVAELVEGQMYKTTNALRIHLAQELEVPEGDDADGIEEIEIYGLADFTQASNDQVLNIEGTFMCYVYFED